MFSRRKFIGGLAAIIAAQKAPSAPVKSLLAAKCTSSSGGGGDSTISARSYVQDGLVAMWDGIENAGWGVHDDSAATWKDCIGGREWTGTSVVVEDDAMVSSGVSSTTGNNIFIYSDLLGTERTREVVLEPITISYGNDPVMRATGDASLDLAMWATRTPELIAFFRNGQTFYSVAPSDTTKVGLTVVNKANTTHGYVNGSFTKEKEEYYTSQGNTVLPYYASNRVRIFSFRVYSRVLSPAEIAANHTIDRIRFNITD